MHTLEAILVAALLLSGTPAESVAPRAGVTASDAPPSVLQTNETLAPTRRVPTPVIAGTTAPVPVRPTRIQVSAPAKSVLPPVLVEHRDPYWSQGVQVDPDMRTWSGENAEDGVGAL